MRMTMWVFMQTYWQRLLVSSSSSSSSLSSSVAMKMPLLLLLLDMICFCHGVGYSYSRFEGPVTGPEQKLSVRNEHTGIGIVDYVGYPKYQFSYGVEDAEQHMLQNRKETRDGDNVQGVYSLVDPDGSLRVVKYTADDVNGFQAEVITNGVTYLYGNTNLNDNKPNNNNNNNGYWQDKRVAHEASEEENSKENDGNTWSEEYNNEYDDDNEYNNNKNNNNSYEYDEHGQTEVQAGSSEEEGEDFDEAHEHVVVDNDDSSY